MKELRYLFSGSPYKTYHPKTYHHKTYLFKTYQRQNLSSQNLLNCKTYQTIKLIKLQNISKLKLINKIHESKFSNHENVPTIF